MAVHYTTCNLCEALCGLEVTRDGDAIASVRGDRDDPLSRGHICPKAAALADLHADPDRLRRPLARTADGGWRELDWDEALDLAATRLSEIRTRHGRDAIGLFVGNPTIHSHGALLYIAALTKYLRTRNRFSTNSVDALPRLLTAYLLYGAQAALPVPDVDRTRFLLIVGANPLVSNGSVMTAPDFKRRLRALRARGGRAVVIDPRRTETAAEADAHHFIRPGTDAYLLAAMLHTIFSERLARPGRLASLVRGLEIVEAAVAGITPERVAPITGVDADAIATLAREFAAAESAVCYGRLGTCTQAHGALTSWLIDCLNIATGNLDRPGGAMFASPAVDLPRIAAAIGEAGSFDRYRSRVSGLPEFGGELPASALVEEIETPGPRQIRALILHATNPVLSIPGGARIERALGQLDFLVAIDVYVNETTRHADLILPPTMGLERPHYGLVFHALAVRNTAKYSRAVLDAPDGAMHDWQILLGLMRRMMAAGAGVRGIGGRAAGWLAERALGRGPEALLRLGLRLGRSGVTLDDLLSAPHGVDLGPLQPRLPAVLQTRSGAVELDAAPMLADLARLRGGLDRPSPVSEVRTLAQVSEVRTSKPDGELALIGRRDLRSNNSWMHNSRRLVKGKPRCVLLMHPDDAAARGIRDGDRVKLTSRVGALEAPVAITDEVMPGVVSLPHGWGHDRDGVRLQVATAHAGVNVNDLTDPARLDAVSGCGDLTVFVRAEPA